MSMCNEAKGALVRRVALSGSDGAIKERRSRPALLFGLSLAALSLLLTLAFPGRAFAAAAGGAPALGVKEGLVAVLPAGFLEAFSLVVLSEIGDKTFFVAGLFAMKTTRLIAFTGAMAALAVMTTVAVATGQLFQRLPKVGALVGVPVADYITIATFLFFGAKLLSEAYRMENGDKSSMTEELDDAKNDLGSVEDKLAGTRKKILQCFHLAFAAEVGDRSFIATVALSAAYNPIAVGLGAIGGHALATGIAVVSGVYLAKYLSPQVRPPHTAGYQGMFGNPFLTFRYLIRGNPAICLRYCLPCDLWIIQFRGIHETPLASAVWRESPHFLLFTRGDRGSSKNLKDLKDRGPTPDKHRGTSPVRTRTPPGPYRRPMPRVLGGS